MVHVEGKLYVFGGEKGNVALGDWEVYSIKDNVWKSIAPLPFSNGRVTAAVYVKEIWIAGIETRILAYDYGSNTYRDT